MPTRSVDVRSSKADIDRTHTDGTPFQIHHYANGRFAPGAAIRKSDGIVMSAFRPEADITHPRNHVSFVPNSRSKRIFGHVMLRFAGEFGLTPVARTRLGSGVYAQPKAILAQNSK
jgi:hypothetical protein